MLYKRWILLSAVAVSILWTSINTYLLYEKRKPSERTVITKSIAPVNKSDFQRLFPTKGVVTSTDIQKLFIPPHLETIDKVLVKSGQAVQVGSPLLSWKNDEIDEQIWQIDNSIAKLQEQIQEIEQSMQDFETKKQDANQHEEIETAILGEIRELQEEKRNIETKINDLTNEKHDLEKQKERQVLKSNVAGIVENIQLDGKHPFISIVTSPYIIQGELSELNLHKIEEGQNVKITPIGKRDNEYIGKIIEIGKIPIHQPTLSEKESLYPFYVQLENGNETLPYGSHVYLAIILKESKDAMSIPKTAVVQEGKKQFVYVINKGKVKKQEVKLGLTNGLKQEIISGLTNHDWVIANPSPAIKEGMFVASPLQITKIKKGDISHLPKKELIYLMAKGFFHNYLNTD